MNRYKMVELGTLIHPAKTVRCGDGDYPVLSMTMHDGLVFQDDKFKKAIASKDKSDYKVVKRNQLVISFPIDEGVLAAQRIVDAGIVSPAYGIWDIDQQKVLPEFLEYALRCDRALNYYIAKLRGSTARRRSLPTPTLLAFTVPLPEISEQELILEVIHKAKSLISGRREEITQLDNLIKARFVELTESTDTVPTKMGDIATYINGYAFKPVQWEDAGYPIVRIQNLNDSNAPYNYYSGKIADKYLIHNGDVLVSWATHLEAYIWKGEEAWLNQHIFKVVFDKIEVDKTYFVYACEEALRQAFRNAHGFKPTMEHIKKADFDAAVVKLPNLQIQKQFAAFVEQVDKSKVVVQKALDEAQTLFDSLMQEYFG